jgi:hypothetical protein
MSVCPYTRMCRLASYWTKFRKISYLGILHYSFKKITILLKSDKDNGALTRRPNCVYILDGDIKSRNNIKMNTSLLFNRNNFIMYNVADNIVAKYTWLTVKYCSTIHVTHCCCAWQQCLCERATCDTALRCLSYWIIDWIKRDPYMVHRGLLWLC